MNNEVTIVKTNSRFDGGLLGLIGINISCFLLCVFTLGIGVPWAIVMKYKWKLSHTIYNGRTLTFDGTGGQIIGSYLLWLFLSIITLGVYLIVLPIKIQQWKVKHTHFIDGKSVGESRFTGRIFGLFGINLLCSFLVIITVTLALPAAIAIKQRWETANTVVDGYRLRFIGQGIGLFGNYLKWILLSLITLFIYAYWIPIKFENWIVSNTELVNPLLEKYIDKYSDEWYSTKYNNQQSKVKHEKVMLFLGIVSLIVSICATSYAIYLLIFIIKGLIYIGNDFYTYLLTSGLGLVTVPYSILSGFILLLIGISSVAKSLAKSKFRIAMQIIGFAVVFLQSSSFLLASIYALRLLFPTIFTNVVYLIISIILLILDTVSFFLSILSISLFAKNYNDICNNRSGSISSHRKLKVVTLIALILTVITEISSIVVAFFYAALPIVMGCTLNVFVIVIIFIYVTNGLPHYYKMTNLTEQSASVPAITQNENENVENKSKLTAAERINKALETGYKNLLDGSLTDEKSRIGLLAIEEAIKLGSITAYAQLGAYYEDRKEYDRAYEKYLEGYQRGSSYAAYFIARMYEEGRGRDKDGAKAHEWYQKAASLGNEASKRILDSKNSNEIAN